MNGRQSMYIRSVRSYPAALEVSYRVEDPLMHYGVVRLKSEQVTYDSKSVEGTEETYDLDPSDTEVILRDLEEDSKYKLTLYYLDETGNRVVMDVAYGFTSNNSIDLRVDKISRDYIEFTATFDEDLGLSYQSVELLYEQGELVQDKDVEISGNLLKEGILSGTITFGDDANVEGDYLTLRVTFKQGKTPLIAERSFMMPGSSGAKTDEDERENAKIEEKPAVKPEKPEAGSGSSSGTGSGTGNRPEKPDAGEDVDKPSEKPDTDGDSNGEADGGTVEEPDAETDGETGGKPEKPDTDTESGKDEPSEKPEKPESDAGQDSEPSEKPEKPEKPDTGADKNEKPEKPDSDLGEA